MAISRMQEPQQIQSGIGSLQDPRQGYFLGKLVKKAVRGVKKIVKSPLGKAALLGLGAYGLGGAKFLGGKGMFSSGQGLARFSNLRNLFGSTSIMKNPVTDTVEKTFMPNKFGSFLTSMNPFGSNFSGKNLAIGLGATAVATPFLQKALKTGPYEALMMAKARNPYMSFLPNQQYVQEGFYQPVANGGRIGYANGEMVEGGPQLPPEAEKFLQEEYKKYVAQGGDLSYPEFKQLVLSQASGEQGPEQEDVMTTEAETIQTEPQMPMMMAEGGLMNLGGMEKDYRAEGGFVPIGKREKADDVPARLSVNEFVFTADAVRNAGGGDIDKGAEVMENLMKNLEAGGKVSEESQGAQAMYDNMKQLETRVV